jgi:5-methylcytosine-specific restriction endonuclease McrA
MGTDISGNPLYTVYCPDHLNLSTDYAAVRKNYCENIDGRLGFVCTTTILLAAQLEVDHIDGNPLNNDLENLQTLCGCCHKYKTIINEDWKTPGRKTRKIQSKDSDSPD